MRTIIWAPIPGYEKYEVSTEGQVRSTSFGKTGKPGIMKPRMSKNYWIVKFSVKGKYKIFRIHQLVAMAFLGHIPNSNGLEVDHIDENKQNNRLENLQLLTKRANISKAYALSRDLPTGVTYDKSRNKFRARIKINYIQKFLGRYNTKEEASEAYQQALKELI
jgi:hypothetical protein